MGLDISLKCVDKKKPFISRYPFNEEFNGNCWQWLHNWIAANVKKAEPEKKGDDLVYFEFDTDSLKHLLSDFDELLSADHKNRRQTCNAFLKKYPARTGYYRYSNGVVQVDRFLEDVQYARNAFASFNTERLKNEFFYYLGWY